MSGLDVDKSEVEEWQICETCLGPNPFLRMSREKYGSSCKICDTATTVYRWKPGPKMRYKSTIVCMTCAKLKNVCQTCLFDMQYGLPVEVRDKALEQHERLQMPTSTTTRDFMHENFERNLENGTLSLPYGKVSNNDMLNRLQRRGPYYRRNLPKLCSFFANGTCTRGAECPFRHEMPTTGPLAKQNIKDRYYGVNDPVAKKLLTSYESSKSHDNMLSVMGPPPPPADPEITTIWCAGVGFDYRESDIREIFSQYGPIRRINHLQDKACAFIEFAARADAELAMKTLFDSCFIKGKRCRLDWGRGQRTKSGPPRPRAGGPGAYMLNAMPPPPGMTKVTRQPPPANLAPPSFNPAQCSHLASKGITAPTPPAFLQSAPPPPGMTSTRPAHYESMSGNYGTAKMNPEEQTKKDDTGT